MSRWLGMMGLAVVLAGCLGQRRRAEQEAALAAASAEALVAQARSRTVPQALRATLGISVQGPTTSGSTRGGLITHRPDDLRVDVFTPLNTPLAYLASDGQALHVWLQQKQTFYRGDDVGAVLDELLGGLAGVGDLIDLLTGTLPLREAPVLDARYDTERGQLRVVLQGPPPVQIQAWLTPAEDGALLQTLLVLQPPAEAPLVRAEYTDYMRVEGVMLPKAIDLTLPALGWTIGLRIDTWNALGQIPDVFQLSPPPGAVEKDLIESLRELAEAQPDGRLD